MHRLTIISSYVDKKNFIDVLSMRAYICSNMMKNPTSEYRSFLLINKYEYSFHYWQQYVL